MTKAVNDLERLRIRLAPTGTHSNVLLQYYEPIGPYIFTVHLYTISRTMSHLLKKVNIVTVIVQ